MRAAAAALLVWGALGCQPPAQDSAGPDVYVPPPYDAASAPADAGPDGAFGLGQVDRVGRPLVSVLLVPGPLDDTYNGEPTFAPSLPRLLSDALEARLSAMDVLALDAGPDPVDWPVPEGGAHPLLQVLASDALLVDTALPCAGADGGLRPGYLALEREAFLGGPAHATCGGRTPGEDVVDETLTLLVTGGRDGGPRVTQGVTGPTRPPSSTFPYLAPPN